MNPLPDCTHAARPDDAPDPRRRRLAFGLPWLASGGLGAALAGCASAPWPSGINAQHSTSAAQRLAESAQAHGLAAYRALNDINVSFDGQWRALVPRLQPALVDAGYRQRSQERLLPAAGVMAQAHTGPSGRKQVLRVWPGAGQDGSGEVSVWYDGQPATGRDTRDAAALVCDGYRLFLLGPMALAGHTGPVSWGAPEPLDGRLCDVLHLQLRPGLGFAEADRLALWVDREQGLMRRVRLSLEGLQSTAGAVAEVDLFDHVSRHGIQWPTRYFERLVRPIPDLPVHDWRLTGLDVNRGYGAEALSAPRLGPLASDPARPLG